MQLLLCDSYASISTNWSLIRLFNTFEPIKKDPRIYIGMPDPYFQLPYLYFREHNFIFFSFLTHQPTRVKPQIGTIPVSFTPSGKALFKAFHLESG